MNKVEKFAAVHEIRILQFYQVNEAKKKINNDFQNGVQACDIGARREYHKAKRLNEFEPK
jgi:hypothetical protein